MSVNQQKQLLESFSNSAYNSPEEDKFMNSTMRQFYANQIKEDYTKLLEKEYGVSKPAISSHKNVGQSVRKFKWVYIVSALALLSIAIYFISKISFSNQPNDALQYAAVNTEIYHNLDLASRGAQREDDKIIVLKKAYEDKNFREVIKAYESIEIKDLLTNQEHFITAISYAQLNSYENAIAAFEVILSSSESSYSFHQESRWYLAMTYLKQGNKDELKKTLLLINEGQDFYADAQKILKGL